MLSHAIVTEETDMTGASARTIGLTIRLLQAIPVDSQYFCWLAMSSVRRSGHTVRRLTSQYPASPIHGIR